MFRAALELLFTILIVLVARAVLTSVLKGIANASHDAFRPGQSGGSNAPPAQNPERSFKSGSELHKDPVCGTYVAESTRFSRRVGLQTFYYCSDACREKHALVAR